MGAAAPIVGIALAAVGTAYSIKVQRDAAEEQEDIQQAQLAAEAQKRIEERRAQHRRERIAKAKVAQASANTGLADSSGEAGAIGSLNTQGAVERLGINVREDATQRIADAQSNLTDLNIQGQIAGSVANLGKSIFQFGYTPTPQPPEPQQPRVVDYYE